MPHPLLDTTLVVQVRTDQLAEGSKITRPENPIIYMPTLENLREEMLSQSNGAA